MEKKLILQRKYRLVSILETIIFAMVGLIFLIVPDKVVEFFNIISIYTGCTAAPAAGRDFYLILAVGYMYMVTLLAYLCYRWPHTLAYPFLLANAKLASALLSLYLYLFHNLYLIYISNFLIDGIIGLISVYFYTNIKRYQHEYSF